MNINHINDLMFSVSYLKHNISNLNELQKEQNDRMLVDPKYKETVAFSIKIEQCLKLHDLYANFFELGDMYKLENLLKEFEYV